MSAGKARRIPQRGAGNAVRQADAEPSKELPAVAAEDEVELASADSFPASDPPSWTGSIVG
jgi:hypothetical protein